MKILPRTVLKIARLYKLADDNTPVKALRRLEIQTDESHVFAEFILNKQHFVLLYGSIVDEESIDDLWMEKPDNAEYFAESTRSRIYRNAVPGKICHDVQNFANQSALGYLFIDQIRHDNFSKSLAKIYKSWIRFGQ